MAEYKHADLKTQLEAAFADNEGGDITAKVLRDNLIHIIDSVVPIMASGTDNYFRNDVDFRDSSVTTSNTAIGSVYGQWDTNTVSAVRFATGNDANTHKDHGAIEFYTSPGILASGTSALSKRMVIDNDGTVSIFGSGVINNADTGGPTVHIKSIHGSGLGLLLEGSERDIGVPNGKNFQLGHWGTGNTFTPRMVVNTKGHLGLGIDQPDQPIHVRHSGDSIRVDAKTAAVNRSDFSVYKYDGDGNTGYTYNDMLVGFGLGVHTAGSGHGYFFIGHDQARDFNIKSTEASFVVDSGGKVGIGNRGPSEKLVVGDDLGKISSSGNALVIGTTYGPSSLIMGSGVSDSNRANYASFKWENDNNRLVLDTRSNYKTRANQFVLDSVTGNVGMGASGVFPKVAGQGTASLTFGIPNLTMYTMVQLP